MAVAALVQYVVLVGVAALIVDTIFGVLVRQFWEAKVSEDVIELEVRDKHYKGYFSSGEEEFTRSRPGSEWEVQIATIPTEDEDESDSESEETEAGEDKRLPEVSTLRSD